jgi:hypothetical protein
MQQEEEEEDHNKKLGTVYSLSLSLSLVVSLWELYSVSLCLSLGEAGRAKKSWKCLKTQLWLSVSEHFSFVCLFVCFFLLFFFFCASQTTQDNLGKAQQSGCRVESRRNLVCPFFLPHQFPKSSRAPASASKRKGS